ncbi:MAG: ExbD/TolR family protein [Marinobacter sp.]
MIELIPPPSTSGKSLMERVEDALLPLINLVFLLLMFFIVAGQLADDPLPDLPATPPSAEQQSPHADLLVDADGHWQISGETLNAQTLLKRLPEPDVQNPLKIGAASSISMADLESLLRTLEQGGYKEILLLTEPET